MEHLTSAIAGVFWITAGAIAVGHAGSAIIRRFVK